MKRLLYRALERAQEPQFDEMWDPMAVFLQLENAITKQDQAEVLSLSRKMSLDIWNKLK